MAPLLLQQILSFSDPIFSNKVALIATTGRMRRRGKRKRGGSVEKGGKCPENIKVVRKEKESCGGDGMAVRKIIALFLLPLHASWQFRMASGHNEGKFGPLSLLRRKHPFH